MRKLKHPNLIALLVGIILASQLLNPLLWAIDPIGLITYRDDSTQLFSQRTPTHEGYVLADGVYDMRGYTATIAGGNRIMPIVGDADCTIAFVGDSVTFAMGVEDNETFAWQIAEKFPDVQFVNEGLPAYNAENNRRVIASSKADGIILIHIHNDDFPLSSFEPQSGERRGALELYLYYLSIEKRNTDYPRDTAAYNAAMDAINEHDNVLTVAFDNDNLLNDDSVARLPLWTTYVSGADFHPDANGHEEITANLLPIVETFVDSICG